MHASRLTLALDDGAFVPPSGGRIAAIRPRAETDLSALPRDRVEVVQGFRPDHDAFARRGYATAVAPGGLYAAAVVFVPRSKAEARALIAEAAGAVAAGGPIAVDGAKSDGVDSLLKELRGRVALGPALAKAHGKLAVFANPGAAAFADWRRAPRRLPGGFLTDPSAFSADGVDPGSAALAAALPARLPARVADLGAGWGWLAAAVLAREGVEEVHLIEAEHAALAAARTNIADPRARFHWADATVFEAGAPFGAVVTNPPFHAGRVADPGLGRAFIAAAARMLAPGGTLWLVANRHLTYERALAEHFRAVEELPGPPAYKLYRATGPAAPARHGRRPALEARRT
jgi:16S rRNA (guanine1207-N2)-methyltransferase